MIPITRLEQIPNTRVESPMLDFKAAIGTYRKGDKWKRTEIAKDLAAMANTHGGAILIGVADDGKQVGIPAGDAESLFKVVEGEVAKELCRPSVLVQCEEVTTDKPGRVIAVVNIFPAPFAPVGVNVAASGQDATWQFPIRVGSHTRFLDPDQFGTLENVSARRIAAQLAAIPESERSDVRFRFVLGQSTHLPSVRASIQSVNSALNRIDLLVPRNQQTPYRSDQPGRLILCLDWIANVWRGDTGWEVTVNEVVLRQQKESMELLVMVAPT